MLASRFQQDPSSSSLVHSILSQSENRVSITFFAPISGGVLILDQPNLVISQGITLQSGMPPVTLHVDWHGDIVQREWYALFLGAVQSSFAWIEAIATCAEDQQKYFGRTTAQRARLY